MLTTDSDGISSDEETDDLEKVLRNLDRRKSRLNLVSPNSSDLTQKQRVIIRDFNAMNTIDAHPKEEKQKFKFLS